MSRRKPIVAVIICLLSINLHAQGNLPYIDDKPFHFGFSLGFTSMDFGIIPSLIDIDGEKYSADVSDLVPGFSVGIISDLRLNRYLNLRVNPTLNLADRQITYTSDRNITQKTLKITSIPACLPVYLKYSSERYKNFRPYLLGGGGVYLDLGRDKTKPLLLKPFDVYTEFGVGCDIYFSFFKLSPELKFAVGLNNMLTPLSERDSGLISVSDQFYTTALSSLTSRMLTLSFNFE
jgi:hypothetical protein